MCYSKKILSYFVCIFAVLIMAGPVAAEDVSNEEILRWVQDEMKVDADYPLPQIYIVSQKELQKVFRNNNKESFKRWAEEFGQEDATKILHQYLNEVVGLFEPKEKIIHVRHFEDACKQESIIAHELAHYLQIMEEGEEEDAFSHGIGELRFFREMQAGTIEERYMKVFCSPVGNDG